MEIRVKVKINSPSEIRDLIKIIRETEKEYSCNCTLLEIETKDYFEIYQNPQVKK